MPRKKHHHIATQEYTTQDAKQRLQYYVAFRDWKQVRRRFPCGDNLRFALKERDRRLVQNAQRFDFDREQQEQERNHLTFAEWAQTWLTLHANKRSIRRDHYSARSLTDFFGEDRLEDVTTSRVAEYKLWRGQQITRHKRPPSIARMNRELALLRSMFILAEQGGKIDRRPVIHLEQENNKRTRIASPEELAQILDAMPTMRARPSSCNVRQVCGPTR